MTAVRSALLPARGNRHANNIGIARLSSRAAEVFASCCRWLPLSARRYAVRGAVGVVAACALVGTTLHALDANRLIAAAQQHGPRTVQQARALEAMLARAAGFNDTGRLQIVNQFFNDSVEWVDDVQVWGQVDYWASPLEMLSKGMGDCEDYSIAKYFSLVTMGMPVSKLRMVYVRALVGGNSLAHMVLAYYPSPNAEPFILDNLIGEIRPASARPDLTPVFSFNSEGLWQGVGAQSAGDPIARLSRWREILVKVRAEGF